MRKGAKILVYGSQGVGKTFSVTKPVLEKAQKFVILSFKGIKQEPDLLKFIDDSHVLFLDEKSLSKMGGKLFTEDKVVIDLHESSFLFHEKIMEKIVFRLRKEKVTNDENCVVAIVGASDEAFTQKLVNNMEKWKCSVVVEVSEIFSDAYSFPKSLSKFCKWDVRIMHCKDHYTELLLEDIVDIRRSQASVKSTNNGLMLAKIGDGRHLVMKQEIADLYKNTQDHIIMLDLSRNFADLDPNQRDFLGAKIIQPNEHRYVRNPLKAFTKEEKEDVLEYTVNKSEEIMSAATVFLRKNILSYGEARLLQDSIALLYASFIKEDRIPDFSDLKDCAEKLRKEDVERCIKKNGISEENFDAESVGKYAETGALMVFLSLLKNNFIVSGDSFSDTILKNRVCIINAGANSPLDMIHMVFIVNELQRTLTSLCERNECAWVYVMDPDIVVENNKEVDCVPELFYRLWKVCKKTGSVCTGLLTKDRTLDYLKNDFVIQLSHMSECFYILRPSREEMTYFSGDKYEDLPAASEMSDGWTIGYVFGEKHGWSQFHSRRNPFEDS